MKWNWSQETDTSVIEYLSKLKVGDKVKFSSEKQRYTIQARNKRFIICTKPFNAKETVLYTIVDIDRYCRGTDNLVFHKGYETKANCEENLNYLANGKMEVSYRNVIKLDVEV